MRESGISGARKSGRIPQRLFAFLTLCVAGLAGAVAADAATVSVSLGIAVEGTLVYQAADGETNHVTVEMTVDLATWLVTEPGAPLVAGQGCTSIDAHHASCPAPQPDPVQGLAVHRVDIALGDMEDWASAANSCFFRV